MRRSLAAGVIALIVGVRRAGTAHHVVFGPALELRCDSLDRIAAWNRR